MTLLRKCFRSKTRGQSEEVALSPRRLERVAVSMAHPCARYVLDAEARLIDAGAKIIVFSKNCGQSLIKTVDTVKKILRTARFAVGKPRRSKVNAVKSSGSCRPLNVNR